MNTQAQAACLHHLFEVQVARSPNAIAVVFEGQKLTYRQLDARANQVARYLQKLGAQPEMLVGICIERSLEMPIGILGILKAGCAYVPLDPAYPQKRLDWMLKDTQMPILLSQRSVADALPSHQARVICLEDDWDAIARESPENPSTAVCNDNLAYIIYTSGSTGTPKGVQIPHRNAVNLIQSLQSVPGLTAQDILLAVVTITFDMSVPELFLPLSVGGRVEIASREVTADGKLLAEALQTSGATVMQATPATWKLLLRSRWEGNKQLRMWCGGEALPRQLADRLLERGHSLWNLYGPTEITVYATGYQVEVGKEPITIGYPVANAEIHLLDEQLRPVPTGEKGELYVGGVGVSRGYLHRPDLTAERFIANPFSEVGDRLYKTGDLARYGADGKIEYLGRIDHQVKIRSFRIELGEIEETLSQHPEVHEATVTTCPDIAGEQQLVAHIVPDRPTEAQQYSTARASLIRHIRSFLRQQLPDYMIPARFVLLNALPLTPNGKVDRKALPCPDRRRPELEAGWIAPRTPVEQELSQLWAEVLGIEQVGVGDSFFELGGHSLLATQLLSRLRDRYRVEIPLRRLFNEPTVAKLAGFLAGIDRNQSAPSPTVMATRKEGQDLPLSFAQQRLWFLDRLEPNNPVYNVCEAVRLQGSLNLQVLENSLQEIVRRHEVLQTVFATAGEQPVQVIQPDVSFALSVIDLSSRSPEDRESEAKAIVAQEARKPFNLAKGPLFRATLLQLDEENSILLLVLHHILCDDWSLGLLYRELGILYKAFSRGRPSPLPEPTLQYADFALWQRQWLQGKVLQQQLAYWQGQLSAMTQLRLQGDRFALLQPEEGDLTRECSSQIAALPSETRQFPNNSNSDESTLTSGVRGGRNAPGGGSGGQNPPENLGLNESIENPASIHLKGKEDAKNIARNTPEGARHYFTLPQELSASLQTLASQEGATLFMLLLAAFKVLLFRYTRQEDIAIASPVANRHRGNVESLIGFFVNILMLRTRLSGSSGFRQLLQQVREGALEAYAYQDLPFEKLVEALQLERQSSGQPLFQVLFALQNSPPLAELDLVGVETAAVEIDNGTAKCELLLQLAETPEGLQGYFEYRTDLFDSGAIARMADHFQVLLEGIAANPDRALADFPLLAASERHQLLFEWNQTQADSPRDRCIHQFFEAQVEQQPDAIALVCGERQLTYRQLNERANQLAHHLQSLGIGADKLVGVYLERSPDTIAAVLGATKAGGAYVPFDPHWPQERLHQILSRQEISCIVTQQSLLPVVRELQWQYPTLNHAICLDADASQPPPEAVDLDAVRLLWDRVAEEGRDRVTAGGFVSSYTGEPFSEAEVDEYVERVATLAQPYLGPDKRVLEIGCGSGLIFEAIAPHIDHYTGLDPSEATQTRNRQRWGDAEWVTGFAHELDSLGDRRFDLIILASTAQFFPGYGYLQQVLKLAEQRLNPGGAILLADLLDVRQKADFQESLAECPNGTATQLNSGLYVDESFFEQLPAKLTELGRVAIAKRTAGFHNELCYRFDVVLEKTAGQRSVPLAPQKRVWTNWHLKRQPQHNPAIATTAENLAYIIYTSGSTGVPKGVTICHRSAANLMDWVNKTFAVGPRDRLLFVTSLCFDLSVYDIFGVLGAGGSLHIASDSEQKDPERLLGLLCEEPITFWDSAPAVLQQLVPFFPTVIPGGEQMALRLVFLSGDWIPITLPDAVRSAFPAAQMVSLGGATETSIWSNYYLIDKVHPQWPSIPYGKPIQNAQYYVLDDRFHPCPIGIAGELYVGGDCLALGYAGDTVKTNERFIANPFSDDPNARMYRTGDLARHLSDGNLEFLGRIDSQVKIRGFRIELGEIETAIRQHPAVRHAAIVVREDTPGNKRLVAYVVPGKEVERCHLRSYLRDKLPGYMVPEAFVLLEAFPLTANGKIDRKALPAPQDISEVKRDFVAPRTPLEQQVARIWSEVLGIERIGIEDRFFELGGNSLLAARAIARLQDHFEIEMPVKYLFEQPTITGLSATIERLRQGELAAVSSTTDLKAEVVLAEDIVPTGKAVEFPREPRQILLTGATGFLGAFLLDELLRETQATIYCLVRSPNRQAGQQKLQRILEQYLLWNPSQESRIIALPGDLEKPRLGLKTEQFEELAREVDSIYHSAAQVNFVKPYSIIKAANVAGTQEILRFAGSGKIKPLHYVSTAGIFGPSSHFIQNHPPLTEETDLMDYADYVALDIGYSQSKWVIEQLIAIAQSRGFPISVLRPGFLLGDTRRGVMNTKDFWSRYIKGCIQLGSFPNFSNQKQEFITVDYASRAIVHLSKQPEAIGKVFHLTPPDHNPTTVELFELIRECGYPLKKLPPDQWKEELIRQTRQSSENALYPLLPVFLEKPYRGELTIMELYQNTPEYRCDNALAGLSGTGITCPSINRELLEMYLSYLHKIGFLQAPRVLQLT